MRVFLLRPGDLHNSPYGDLSHPIVAHRAVKIYRSNSQRYKEFFVSTLYAMTCIGNSDTLRAMRQFAKTANKQDPAMFGIVQECIATLEERLQSESGTRTLLRASTQTTSPDMLLRPASDTTQTATDAPEQLLRAAPIQDNAPPAPLPSRTAQATSEEAEQVLRGATGQDSTTPD